MEKEGVEFYEGLPTRDEVNNWSESRQHMVLVLDDMMQCIVNNVEVQHFFTASSHHRNISIIVLSQNIFAQFTLHCPFSKFKRYVTSHDVG